MNRLIRLYTIARMTPRAIVGRPLWAFVWVTRHCNQACEHCYIYDNSKPHMDFRLYQQTIDKLKELGVVFVSIYGGEPTLHPRLIDMIKYARSRGRKVFLNTDFTVVPTQLLTEIIKAGPDIVSFSLDKIKPSKSNTRSIDAVENKIATVSDLKSLGYHFALHCNTTWYKENLSEAKGVIEYLCEKGNIGITLRPMGYPFPARKVLDLVKNVLLDREDFEDLRELTNWIIEKKNNGCSILNPYAYLKDLPKFVFGDNRWDCGACRDILSIDVDGTIIQCSYFLQDVAEPLMPICGHIGDLTVHRIKEYRAIVDHNLKYCNPKCYSPAYFCTVYYRKHLLKLLQYYLKG